MGRLEDIVFENRILHDLPVDEGEAHTPRPVRGAVCARVRPTPTATPQLVAASPEAIELLGLEPAEVIMFLTRSCPLAGRRSHDAGGACHRSRIVHDDVQQHLWRLGGGRP